MITLLVKEAPTDTTDEQSDPQSMGPSPISSKKPGGQPVTKPSQAPSWRTLTLLGCCLPGPTVGLHAADGLPLQSSPTGADLTVIQLPAIFEAALGRQLLNSGLPETKTGSGQRPAHLTQSLAQCGPLLLLQGLAEHVCQSALLGLSEFSLQFTRG